MTPTRQGGEGAGVGVGARCRGSDLSPSVAENDELARTSFGRRMVCQPVASVCVLSFRLRETMEVSAIGLTVMAGE